MPTVDELLGPESETVDSLLGPTPPTTASDLPSDKTFMSQLAVKVPEVISEWGITFEQPLAGDTPADSRMREGINEQLKKMVLKEATRRLTESPMAGVGRSAQQVAVGTVEAVRSPEGLALLGLAAVQPELGVPAMVVRGAQATSAGAMSGILAKQIGTTAGTIAGGGVKTMGDWTREIMQMGLATLGTAGAYGARARALRQLDQPASVAETLAPRTTAAVTRPIPFEGAPEHAAAAPSRISVIREAGKPEPKGGILAEPEMLELLPEPTVETLTINELTRSAGTEMQRLVAEEGKAVARTGEALPKPSEQGAIPTGALPAPATMAQEPAGIRMRVEMAVEEPKGGLPTAEPTLDLLPAAKVEELAINELLRQGIERGDATQFVESLGSTIRRQKDYPKAVADKIVQQIAEGVKAMIHPDKPMTANQVKITHDSLVRAIQENRLKPTSVSPEAMSNKELLDAVLERIPPEMRGDIRIKGIKKDVEFPATLEGSGAIFKSGYILLEKGEPITLDTVLHEALHDYVLRHPELYDPNQMLGMEKAVDKLHSEILAKEKANPGIISGSKLEKWADEQIAEGRGRLNVGLDPVQLAAYAVKGAAMLERGITSAAEWTAAMLKEYGEGIRPYLGHVRRESERVRQATMTAATKVAMQPTEPRTKPLAAVNLPTTLGNVVYYQVKEGAEIKGSDGTTYKAGDMISEGELKASGHDVPGKPATSRPGIQELVPVEDTPVKASEMPSFLSRFFTKERGLSDEAYKAELKRRGAITENAIQAKYAVRDLTRAVGEETGQGVASVAITGLRNASPELIQKIDDVLHGTADPNSLPEGLREPVVKMRAHIDALSSQLQDLVGAEIAAVIEKNKGVYLTRSHRVFEDPKWVFDNVPLDVRNNVKRIVQEEMNLTDVQAESYLRDLFADWKKNGVEGVFNPRRLGSKDISVLMRRKDLSPEFQAFMGTYKDPFINYMRSVSKLSRLVADQKFLNGIREMGMGKWLFEDGQNPPGFNSLISGAGSETFSPLNGLRTSEHIARVFNEWGKRDVIENPVFKALMAVNAVSKASKTVYSVMTQIRNMQQMWFWLANGHYRVGALKEAIGTVMSDIGAMKDADFRAYHQKLAKLNLTNESAFGGELRDMIGDFSKKLMDQNVSPMDYGLANTLKTIGIKAPERAYQLADEFGKIVGFEAEKARLARDNPTMPLDALEAEAAFRVRNTYPTYSNIPTWMQKFRRVPLIGPFISFPYEIIRTVGHGLNYLRQDLATGNLQSATERGLGLFLALGGLTAGMQVLSRHLLGLTAKDDLDLRSQLPPWEKNSTLLYTDKEPGKVSYINLSYNNPYSYFSDPLIAATTAHRDEGKFLDSMIDAAGEFLQPWTSEQMLAGALIDAKRNTDQNGRHIYNPQASTETKIEAVLGHVWKNALEPGTLTRLRTRIIPSFEQQPSIESMDKPTRSLSTPAAEITAELTGFRERNHDFVDALRYRGQDFTKGIRDTTALFTENMRNPTKKADPLEQYKTQEDARFRLYQQLARDIQVARRQGGTLKDIAETLQAAGIGKETIEQALNLKYLPYVPGKEVLAAAKKAGHPIPEKKIGELIKQRSQLVLNP